MDASGSLNYKTLFELITTAIIVTDKDLKVIFANKSASSLLETDLGKLQNQTLSEWIQIPDNKISRIRGVAPGQGSECVTCSFHHNENEITSLLLTFKGIPLPMGQSNGYYIEIKRAEHLEITEEQLQRIGFKTNKIAHDISNPLAVLKIQCDNFSLIAQKKEQIESTEVIKRMTTMSKATDRLNLSNGELKQLAKSLSHFDMDEFMSLTAAPENQDTIRVD